MRGILAGLSMLAAGEAGAATLTDRPCPFAGDITTHQAICSRFSREDDGVRVAFDIAVLTPSTRKSIGHVLYIPGGPGEAPVSEDGLFDDLLIPFTDRTIVMFNPRGTGGTEPRLTCDFGASIWEEDFGGEAAQYTLRDCVARFDRDGPDPARFTSLEIAEDIHVLVGLLGIVRTGIYGISYGTEAGLHLIAQAPPWLEFAILDSVSVPGVSGLEDELAARDRFLAAFDRSCFTEERCSAIARDGETSLSEWIGQFDDDPLVFYLNDDNRWAFEGRDILDYLSQLGAYRDGLDLAHFLVELLQTGRLRALGWISADVTANTEFAAESLPLMLAAYSDTFDPRDFDTVRQPTRYSSDLQSALQELEFYRLWHGSRPREANFLTGQPMQIDIPVLLLSGGIDPFTPVEWAQALHVRLSGLQHYVFPHLGHAVSVDSGALSDDPDMTTQLRCASGVVRAFLDPTIKPDDECRRYRTGDGQ